MFSQVSAVGRKMVFWGICVVAEKMSMILFSLLSKWREEKECYNNLVLVGKQLVKILIAFFTKVLAFNIFLN